MSGGSRLAMLLLAAGATGGSTACRAADAAPEIVPDVSTRATSGLTMPSGWRPIPAIAAAATAALEDPTAIDGAQAWGEPALGCYAVWISMRGTGDAAAIGARIVSGLGGEPELVTSELVGPVATRGASDAKGAGAVGATQLLTLAFGRVHPPAGAGSPTRPAVTGVAAVQGVGSAMVASSVAAAAAMGIAGPPARYHGRLRAKIGGGRVILLACFASEREPVTCDAACGPLLGGVS